MTILTHSFPRQSAAAVPVFLLLLLLTGVLTVPRSRAQDAQYQQKAAFLINFAQYVEWPAHAFPASDSPFVFGVLGDNPFGTALKDLIGREVINGRKAVIEQYKSVQQIGRCQILYISESERTRLPAIMRALKDRSVLTVSDIENFSSEGGMICFVTQTRVRFRVNTEAAQKCNLTISSKLLRLAEVIEPTKPK